MNTLTKKMVAFVYIDEDMLENKDYVEMEYKRLRLKIAEALAEALVDALPTNTGQSMKVSFYHYPPASKVAFYDPALDGKGFDNHKFEGYYSPLPRTYMIEAVLEIKPIQNTYQYVPSFIFEAPPSTKHKTTIKPDIIAWVKKKLRKIL